MKKILCAIAATFYLSACTAPQPATPSQPVYDMRAVQRYQNQVASGHTVSAKDKARVAQQGEDPMPMNRSDNRTKYSRGGVYTPVVVPTIGLGYHRHHW